MSQRFNSEINYDDFSRYDARTNSVRLYSYDWQVYDAKCLLTQQKQIRIKPCWVGLHEEGLLQLVLSSVGESLNVKISLHAIHLIDDAFLNKIFTYDNAILNLEFMNSVGYTIGNFSELPCQQSYKNDKKKYIWEINGNLSRFIDNEVLIIKVKLSLRYLYLHHVVYDSSDPRSIDVLAQDMSKLLLESICPNLVIEAENEDIFGHEAILLPLLSDIKQENPIVRKYMLETEDFVSTYSKYFNSNKKYTIIEVQNENSDVLLAFIHYLYTGRIHATYSLNGFHLYEFSKKYNLHDIITYLRPIQMSSFVFNKIIKIKTSTYEIQPLKIFNLESPYLETRVGDDVIVWKILLFCTDMNNITLKLLRIQGEITGLKISSLVVVVNFDGSTKIKKFLYCDMYANSILPMRYHHTNFETTAIPFTMQKHELPYDTLLVQYELSVFKPREYQSPDVCCSWSSNLLNLTKSVKFSDISLEVQGYELRLHKAILSARSRVFKRMFETDMIEKSRGCVKIEDSELIHMEYALYYIYTGKISNLTLEHAPQVYYVAEKYELLDLKERCSEVIIKHIDDENVLDVHRFSYLYNDKKMKRAAEIFLWAN